MWRFQRQTSYGLTAFVVLLACGCGANPGTPEAPLAITAQPSSETTPLGQTATFSVSVSGGDNAIRYRWSKNGQVIANASSASYATPPVTNSDNGALFSVQISDGGQSLQSAAAKLTIGPRSPTAGDLRFQNVASPLTSQGYTPSISTILLGRAGLGFSNAFGTPLALGPGSCQPDSTPVLGCAWAVNSFSSSASLAGMSVAYRSGYLEDLTDYFDTELADPNTVVTSLDAEDGDDLFAVATQTSTTAGTFRGRIVISTPGSFQSDVNNEASRGRVVTAVGAVSGVLTLTSYAWSQDPSTIYEAQTISGVALTQMPAEVQSLAQAGYIITAFGGNSVDGYFLVGTRQQGDSIPRPISIVPTTQYASMVAKGYAIVGVLANTNDFYSDTWIGEK